MVKQKVNSNLWKGKFKIEEMRLYDGLTENELNIVLEYQKRLPCLQDENGMWIDSRVLHDELKVSKHYADWIKSMIEQLDLEENLNYKSTIHFQGKRKNVKTTTYEITIEAAKEIAMIAGVANRANKELKEMGKLARKYFIAIEKAFKYRTQWNDKRQGTIDTFHDLRQIIFTDIYHKNKLRKYLPSWWTTSLADGRLNTYAYELYMLDLVIIGMSASDYRKQHNIKSYASIRNTFDEKQLKDFEMLQSKSAEYLSVNNIWNTNDRFDVLKKYYTYYKNKVA